VNSIPNSAGFTLPGGKIGVLVIHGFTGSPVSIAPWAKFLNKSGYTVSAPLLPGHGSSWQQMNQTTWQDWYEEVEKSFLELKQSCDRVFIAGFSMGAALALRLCQIRGSEVEGLIVLNPSVHDRRWFMKYVPVLKFLLASHAYDRTPLKALDSLRKLWALVERDLYLIDLPIMVAYSVNDHAVDPENAMTVIDNVFSVDIREVVFENSFHNVALDFDAEQLNIESKKFIEDVLSGAVKRGSDFNENDLVNAEFDSIVSGLSLDQSAPTTYLDELDKFSQADRFRQPNPGKVNLDQMQRLSAVTFVGSFIYLILFWLTDFEFFGAWPAVLGFITSVATIIWRTARKEDDFDDGASL